MASSLPSNCFFGENASSIASRADVFEISSGDGVIHRCDAEFRFARNCVSSGRYKPHDFLVNFRAVTSLFSVNSFLCEEKFCTRSSAREDRPDPGEIVPCWRSPVLRGEFSNRNLRARSTLMECAVAFVGKGHEF